MATLLQLRTRLNLELGIATDGDNSFVPWSQAARTQAIGDGYAELWRVGVYKDAKQDIATSSTAFIYPLTTIRRLERLEVLDSSSRVVDLPRGVIEPDATGTNTYQVRLVAPLAAGFTLRVRGWTAYKSVFSGDGDNDDLPAEHVRVPLLKAKAILYRNALGTFARYRNRQNVPPELSITAEQFLTLIAAAEREFDYESGKLAAQRRRTSLPRRV